MSGEVDPFRAMRLILAIRQAGITDHGVLSAIEQTPREGFVEPHFASQAYEDVALPIPCGQTITRPVTAAGMIEALDLGSERNLTVLEIGTGTGYNAAILSRMARRVFTIDRFRTLVDLARANLDSLGIQNVEVRHGDGLKGWPEVAPFDRILVTAAAEDLPPLVLDQLKPGGIMVIPLGGDQDQTVVRVTKQQTGELDWQELAASRFLPLVEGTAREL